MPPPNEGPEYDIKTYDGKAPALKISSTHVCRLED